MSDFLDERRIEIIISVKLYTETNQCQGTMYVYTSRRPLLYRAVLNDIFITISRVERYEVDQL